MSLDLKGQVRRKTKKGDVDPIAVRVSWFSGDHVRNVDGEQSSACSWPI